MVAETVPWTTTVIARSISVIAGPIVARPVVIVIFIAPLLGGNRTANGSDHRSHDRQSRRVTPTVVPATAGAGNPCVSPPDGVAAETPVEMGPAELAAAIGGSAIVRTSTAIVAVTTPRRAEEIEPLRPNI